MDSDYSDDDCCICFEVMWEPTITPCKHYLCLTCLENILRFKRICPLCRGDIPTSFVPVIHKEKQKEIKGRHKEALAKNMKQLKLQKLFCDNLTLSYGNTHKIVDAADGHNTHAWSAFVRSADSKLDISKFVQKVVYTLHPTFKNPVIEVTSAPFRITRVGWGTFPVKIEVHWQSWLQKGPTRLEHDLSFEGSGQSQSVNVKFDKSIFQDEDDEQVMEEEKKEEQVQQVPVLNRFQFYYGNRHEQLDNKSHAWTAFVKPADNSVDVSKYIQKVRYILHPTFKNPIRDVTAAPFELACTGWGTFEIGIIIYWDPSLGKAPTKIMHDLSFEGNGASSLGTLQL